jgi:glycosyltransferase involved in cell wall biosynthesis
VAQVEIERESGMGRVAWHWREALEARGYAFIHLGPDVARRPVHPALFPLAAFLRYRSLGLDPAAILVHEPAGLPFVMSHPAVIVFSHGLERRGWQATLERSSLPGFHVRRRSRLLFPIWRLGQADFSLRHARALLVLNSADLAYAQRRYHRDAEDVFLFRNGIYPPVAAERSAGDRPSAILFIGSWSPRKGVGTIVAAASLLHGRGIMPRFILAGTGQDAGEVLRSWPEGLREAVSVLPHFTYEEEPALYSLADIFLLPSLFEGQPLALLQAMAAGCCCLASAIAGNRDLITHRRTGLLHTAGDAEQLAADLLECLGNPTLRKSLGENARAAVAARTWPAVAGEVADFVASVVDGKP